MSSKIIRLIIITGLFSILFPGALFASGRQNIEAFSLAVQNQSIKQAVNEFQKRVAKNVNLPQVSPFSPTSASGSVNDNMLELEYINDTTKRMLKVVVGTEENKPQISSIQKNVTLKNGIEAHYVIKRSFVHLNLEKNGLHYNIGLSKNGVSEEDTLNELMLVAESLN
ncbi:hypothetical protein [Paenibacillus humicola]|uniref:hypothetical protein n=1 Tax=Paenibacillus humicola TaxID=3110540 RepID=UPI00237A7AB5|nr:hypothetical protein [Paenibacillus humicola]